MYGCTVYLFATAATAGDAAHTSQLRAEVQRRMNGTATQVHANIALFCLSHLHAT
jgi:hypothetical protein